MTKARFLHIKVYTEETIKTDFRVSLKLLKTVSRMPALALKWIPREVQEEMAQKGISLSDMRMDELAALAEKANLHEHLLQAEVLDPVDGRTFVRIFIDE